VCGTVLEVSGGVRLPLCHDKETIISSRERELPDLGAEKF